jgi:hypothetical protein
MDRFIPIEIQREQMRESCAISAIREDFNRFLSIPEEQRKPGPRLFALVLNALVPESSRPNTQLRLVMERYA